jgi:hypothetical protein
MELIEIIEWIAIGIAPTLIFVNVVIPRRDRGEAIKKYPFVAEKVNLLK